MVSLPVSKVNGRYSRNESALKERTNISGSQQQDSHQETSGEKRFAPTQPELGSRYHTEYTDL